MAWWFDRPNRLGDGDVAERLFAIKTVLYPAGAGLVLGALAGFYLMAGRGLGLGSAAAAVAVATLAGAGLGLVMWFASGWMSRGLVGVLTGAGNLPPAPSFSLQESLIMQGRYLEAARLFENHIAATPADDDARLALAELMVKHLHDSGAAEGLLREVVRRGANERAAWTAANGLIDLYRAAGERGPLMAELARFAERYRSTAAGAAAKRELLELKAKW